MSKSFYPANDAEFALWLANFISKSDINKDSLEVSEDEIHSLTSELQGFNADLALKQQKQEESVAQTAKVANSRKSLNEKISNLNAKFKANKAITSDIIESLGLNSKDNNLSSANVTTPSDLVVTGTSDGINHLKWNRGNNRQGTNFIIEAKLGNAETWSIVDVVTNSKFEHINQTPGMKAQYRVKAKRGEITSGYSNVAVVYG